MKCPYCGTEFELEALQAYDEALKAQPEDNMQWEAEAGTQWQEGETDGMRVYTIRGFLDRSHSRQLRF